MKHPAKKRPLRSQVVASHKKLTSTTKPLLEKRLSLIAFVLVFGMLGIWALVTSHAASTAPVAREAEAGTRTASALQITDSRASGGRAVKFGTTLAGPCLSGALNAPGTADPWGGCWPGPQNTGYPHGVAGDTRTPVTLTKVNNDITVTSCGTVIDSKEVMGGIGITASNGTHDPSTPCVIIKNSLIHDNISTHDINSGPVVIMDTELSLPLGETVAAAGFYNTYDWRLNSHGSGATIKCGGYCTSHDSWVHDFVLSGYVSETDHRPLARHYNAFGGNGIEAGGFDIEHGYASCNFIASYPPGFNDPSLDASGCSSDIGFYGDYAEIQHVTVNRTYLVGDNDGNTAGAYCLRVGANSGGKPYQNPNNNSITNNIFGLGKSGKCGFGPAYPYAATSNGNVWSNNKYDDGSAVLPPI